MKSPAFRASSRRRVRPRNRLLARSRPLSLEPLEDRALLAAWVAQGPAPSIYGGVENVRPNDEVVGAIQTVVAHPTDPDVLFAGAVNGGIWRTDNATAQSPDWEPLTDDLPSLSISAMDMDPADSDRLLAGTGRYSSFADSGPLAGLMLTEDGGQSWTVLDDALLVEKNISGVALRGNVLLAAAGGGFFDGFDRIPDGGMFRSGDGGASWNSIEVLPRSFDNPDDPVPFKVLDLVGDPTSGQRFYASVQNEGIFRSDDGGLFWTDVSSFEPALNDAIRTPGNNNLEMAVATDGRIYTAVLTDGAPSYIGYSDTSGGFWIGMDLPMTPEVGGVDGLNPDPKAGGQGSIHFSIVADPDDPKTVYVGGDRQGGAISDFPNGNFIGATGFVGRLFRGDTRVLPTGDDQTPQDVPSPQWEHLTHSNSIVAIPEGGTRSGSAPHADSREMVFDAAGNLIQVDDGGIYRRTSPRDNTGDWFSVIGDLQVTEIHNVAYDSNSNIIIGGTQDNGTLQQLVPGDTTWSEVSLTDLPFRGGGDGGDVAVDDTSSPGFSIRYSSVQFLGQFRRQVFDATNTLIDQVLLPFQGDQFVTPLELNSINQRRLVIGTRDAVYESFDQGDNFTPIPGPGGGARGVGFGQNAIAYGGWYQGFSNPDVLYVGSGDEVLVRSLVDEPLALTPAPFPGGEIRDIVLNPGDWMTAYVIDQDTIFQTIDAGRSWTEITGNLPQRGVVELRSLLFINGAVVVGTDAGVYISPTDKLGFWGKVGADLPNAPVYDMDFDGADNVLVIGTLGRGAWLLDNAAGEVAATAEAIRIGAANLPPPATASISGQKWLDLDGDGLFEPLQGETPLGFVYIYADLNDDRFPGIDEPGAITATGGSYTLSGLAAGTYTIREALAPGMVQTYPGEAGDFVHIVTVADGEAVTGIDFGNQGGTTGPPENRDPTAVDNSYETDNETDVTGNVVTDDTGEGVDFDPDFGDVLAVTAVNGSAGNVGAAVVLLSGATLTVQAGGQFQYDPTTSATFAALAPGARASDSFSYTLSDGQGGTDQATVALAIVGAAEPPGPVVAFQFDTFDTSGAPIADGGSVDQDERFELRVSVEDPRGFFGTGVFAAYLDVLYDDTRVSVVVGETQTLEITGAPTGGSYQLTFAGQTTAPIPLGTDAGPIEAALEALLAIGTGNVRVRRVPPTDEAPNPFVFEITFRGDLAEQDVAAITVDDSGLIGGTGATVSETYPADVNNAGSFLRAFTFGDDYPNGLSAARQTNVLDEVGAFDGEVPLGGGVRPLFSVVLSADQPGPVTFTGQAADVSPNHDVLLFGSNDKVPPASIDYGGTAIFVTEVANNPPTATPNSYGTDEDNTVAGNVITDDTGAGADFDPDPGDTISVTALNGAALVGTPTPLPSGATLTVNSDGSFVYDPTTSSVLNSLPSGQSATDVFNYTITDTGGKAATANVSITIDGRNDAPTVGDRSFTVEDDAGVGTQVGTVSASDPDVGDSLAFAITGGDPGGTFEIDSASGLITVADTTELDAGTVFSLSVEVTDSGIPTLSDTATVTVTVAAVGQALVRFRLEAVSPDGTPLPVVGGKPVVNAGEDFLLRGFVEDTRGFTATGVFSAYLDVFYDDGSLVSIVPRETQTLTLSANVTGGSYVIALDGEETGPIALGSSVSQAVANLQQALDGLSGIGPGNVRVTNTPLTDPDDPDIILNPFLFAMQFVGDLAGQDVPNMTVDPSGLTASGGPASAVIEETYPADASDPGTFTSSFDFLGPFVNGQRAFDEPAEAGRPASERVLGEVGAFDGQNPIGGGEFPLFSIAMNADAVGEVTFLGNTADQEGNDVLVFGDDDPVPLADIDYGDPVTIVIASSVPAFSNPIDPLDVNNDGQVTPLDVLHIFNELNRNGSRALVADSPAAATVTAGTLPATPLPTSYVDVNGDNLITPLDALIVINRLNRAASRAAGTAAPVAATVAAAAVDAAVAEGLAPTGQARASLTATFATDIRTVAAAAVPDRSTPAADGPAAAASVLPDLAPLRHDPPAAGAAARPSLRLVSADLETALSEVAEDIATAWQDETAVDRVHGQVI